MSEKSATLVRNTVWRRLGRVERYWFLIAFFLLIAFTIYASHLLTGFMPDRAAFRIPVVELEVYWYGIWIVGGILLGAYVVSRLAEKRARRIFTAVAPSSLRNIPLTQLDLPQETAAALRKQKLDTAGAVCYQWGLDKQYLGLDEEEQEIVQAQLLTLPGFQAEWVADAPWRIYNPDHVWNGILWCLLLGLIGARLYHVLTPSPSMAAVGIESPLDYLRRPDQLLNVRNGGLGIYGGIAGGALGLWLYTRRHRIPLLGWADLAVIGLALGQVFGRWGNFFNQELYGRPTDLPWAITIEPTYRLPAYSEFARFHPAFLYESLWSLLTFLVLWWLVTRKEARLLPGDLMALYLIFYGIGRTLLEMVRLDSRTMQVAGLDLNMAVATFVSLLVAALMGAWLIVKHRRAAESGQKGTRINAD